MAGRFDVAMENFGKASSEFNSNAAYNESRGVAEIKCGDYISAIESLSKSNSNSSTTAYNPGLAYLLANKCYSSLALLDTALMRGVDSAQTLYTKAISTNRFNNRNLTVKCLRETFHLRETFQLNPGYNDFFHQDHEFDNINKVPFPRYADSLTRPVRRFKKSSSYQLPEN